MLLRQSRQPVARTCFASPPKSLFLAGISLLEKYNLSFDKLRSSKVLEKDGNCAEFIFIRHKKKKKNGENFSNSRKLIWIAGGIYSKIRKIRVSSSSRNPSTKIKPKAKEVRCNHVAVVADDESKWTQYVSIENHHEQRKKLEVTCPTSNLNRLLVFFK